jgi:hypothetical protein
LLPQLLQLLQLFVEHPHVEHLRTDDSIPFLQLQLFVEHPHDEHLRFTSELQFALQLLQQPQHDVLDGEHVHEEQLQQLLT